MDSCVELSTLCLISFLFCLDTAIGCRSFLPFHFNVSQTPYRCWEYKNPQSWGSLCVRLFFFIPMSISRGLILLLLVELSSATLVKTERDLLCYKIPVNTASSTCIPQSACGILRMLSRGDKGCWIFKNLVYFSHFSHFHTQQVLLCHVIMQIMLSGCKCAIADGLYLCVLLFCFELAFEAVGPWN